MKLVAIVLAFNEAQHLPRSLESLKGVADKVLVVDSFSTDDTVRVAEARDVQVVQRKWVNYANQFNWALTQVNCDADWILRIDADEYLTPTLATEIKERLATVSSQVDGIYCSRRMTFQGRLIRHGGVFPVRVVRLFRYGRGQCENRWMDEHIKVAGPTVDFKGDIVDDNLNSLTWWTEKHNNYASREAVDLLNLKYCFMGRDSVASLKGGSQVGVKRWLKESVYAHLPSGFRAVAYFFYRYVVRLGFLEGQPGTAFHVLQGLWYRYLVDAKVAEVERFMAIHQCDAIYAIAQVLDIKLDRQATQPERSYRP